jgi:hypothetical protein
LFGLFNLLIFIFLLNFLTSLILIKNFKFLYNF